ncbi:MAG: hypothetical protein C4536_02635 [Actinobacteria bacterium]|jgi:hypothetical protein|nr:MAG: hypothetical protein C4536_02635 [Actinomycetota bacterium]
MTPGTIPISATIESQFYLPYTKMEGQFEALDVVLPPLGGDYLSGEFSGGRRAYAAMRGGAGAKPGSAYLAPSYQVLDGLKHYPSLCWGTA